MKTHSFLLALLTGYAAHASAWTGNMQDGSVVRVDPATRQATRFSDQGANTLWDGVHRTDSGGVLIVKDGVVVSGGDARPAGEAAKNDKPSQEGKAAQSTPDNSKPDPACVSLVVKVCGFDGQCNDSPACSPARQLLDLQRNENWQSGTVGAQNTTEQCREALSNESFFAACQGKPETAETTPCTKLVGLMCGPQLQCVNSPACASSRYLLSLEEEEGRNKIRRPERINYTSLKCVDAMNGSELFQACAGVHNPAEEKAATTAPHAPEALNPLMPGPPAALIPAPAPTPIPSPSTKP